MNKFIKPILIVLCALNLQAEVSIKSEYRIDDSKLCDGYPQVSLHTPVGYCVGMVVGGNPQLSMPRYAAQANDGTIYISDMGGWSFANGTIWAMRNDHGNIKLHNLFPNKKLTMPNGIAVDPEGRVYVGTPTGILRFHPRNAKTNELVNDPATENIINQFAESIFRKQEYANKDAFNATPKHLKHLHPHIQFAFNKNFTELYFNVAAPSSDCSKGLKTLSPEGSCIQAESPLANAAVWKAEFSNDSDRKVLKVQSFSRGLRNSMALAVHPVSNLVLQGENGIDLLDFDKPFEELNVLEENQHYGWPYCHSSGEVSPFFVGKIEPRICAEKYKKPAAFLQAHTAPLGMFYYQGDKLPMLKDKLVMSWHGYARAGHRIVSWTVDETGHPIQDNALDPIVQGWEPLWGVRPLGAPTGILQLQDGSVLVIDDKNAAILRLSTGVEANLEEDKKLAKVYQYSLTTIQDFKKLIPFVKKNCQLCHSQFQKDSAAEILQEMTGSMLNPNNPLQSPFARKLAMRLMPPESAKTAVNFKEDEYVNIKPLIDKFIKGINPEVLKKK